jgi:hypothetical protein
VLFVVGRLNSYLKNLGDCPEALAVLEDCEKTWKLAGKKANVRRMTQSGNGEKSSPDMKSS